MNEMNQLKVLLNDLNGTPPQYLYHYGTLSGLLGILNSKAVWASDTSSLNDKHEITHANSVLQDVIENVLFSMGIKNSPIWPEIAIKIKSIEALFGRCVVSFCEDHDQLSLWRPYASDGMGASVGFLSNAMAKAVAEQGFELRKVVYDLETQGKICKNYIIDLFDRFKINNEKAILSKEVIDDMRKFVNTVGIFFKHSSFQDEREWRLISNQIDVADTRWRYRAKENMIAPYLVVDLCKLFDRDRKFIEGDDKRFPPFIITLGPRVRHLPTGAAIQGLTHSILGIGYGPTISGSPYQG